MGSVARRSNRGKPRRGKNAWGWIGLVGGLSILFCFAGAYAYFSLTRINTDRIGCPSDKSTIPVFVTILFDTTDLLSLTQREYVRGYLHSLLRDMPLYGRIELYSVRPVEEDLPKEIFSACRPQHPSEASSLNSNKRLLNRQWTEGFDQGLEEAFNLAIKNSGAEQSPIVEMIKAIAVKNLFGDQSLAHKRKFVLVSDMLQHSSRISHYPRVPNADSFFGGDSFAHLRPELHGTDVEILYLRRPESNVQGRDHVRWWEEFFTSSGAVVVRVKSVN